MAGPSVDQVESQLVGYAEASAEKALGIGQGDPAFPVISWFSSTLCGGLGTALAAGTAGIGTPLAALVAGACKLGVDSVLDGIAHDNFGTFWPEHRIDVAAAQYKAITGSLDQQAVDYMSRAIDREKPISATTLKRLGGFAALQAHDTASLQIEAIWLSDWIPFGLSDIDWQRRQMGSKSYWVNSVERVRWYSDSARDWVNTIGEGKPGVWPHPDAQMGLFLPGAQALEAGAQRLSVQAAYRYMLAHRGTSFTQALVATAQTAAAAREVHAAVLAMTAQGSGAGSGGSGALWLGGGALLLLLLSRGKPDRGGRRA